MHWIILIFFGIVSFVVSQILKSKFRKYSATPLKSGMSGAEVAAMMLRDHRIHDVQIICVPGQLTDHYDPHHRTVNLSDAVYHGRNAAAVAVAAHECGHAVQHATAYGFLEMRSKMVPIQNVSSKILNLLFLLGIVGGLLFQIHYFWTAVLIIACYTVFTIFSFITLPVEFDASARALRWIDEKRIVTSQEHSMAKDALFWAAMTYVVAALSSLVTLLYYVMRMFGSRD